MSFTKFEKIGNKFISEEFTVDKQGNRYYKGEDTLAEIVGNHINIDLSLIGGGTSGGSHYITANYDNNVGMTVADEVRSELLLDAGYTFENDNFLITRIAGQGESANIQVQFKKPCISFDSLNFNKVTRAASDTYNLNIPHRNTRIVISI